MSNLPRRMWSILLTCAMLLTLLPVTALAVATENCENGPTCTQHEAAIGTTHYDTLVEAVTAAQSGDTIILLADCSAEDIVINKGITLDLNGKTVTAAGGSEKDAFYVMLGGDLNLTGSGAIAATGLTRAFDVVGNTAAATWDATTGRAVLTVGSDVTVTTENELCIWIGGKGAAVNLYGSLTAGQKNPVVQGNGTNNATTNNGGTEINIYPGAKLTSASVAMYLPQSGTTNISGGTVEGYAAIGIKSGTLNITGGTVKGTKDDTVLGDEHSATNGIAYDGSAIVIDSYIGYAGKMNLNISGDAVIQSAYSTVIREIGNNTGATNVVSIDISGGTLTGGTGKDCVKVRDVTAKTVSITGGTFSSNVEQFVPTGYKCDLNEGSSTYTVSKIDDQLVVEGKVDTSSGTTTVSGTLGGVFNTGTDIADNVDGGTNDSETGVEDNAITVDLTTAEDTPAAGVTTLTVQADTAATLAAAGSLTIVSDAGSVTLPGQALAKMGGANGAVTIEVVRNNVTAESGVAASYSVSVTDESGANLLPNTASETNGTITITVDKPTNAGGDLQAWYVYGSGSAKSYVEQLDMTETAEGQLAIKINHLSTVELLNGAPSATSVASVTSGTETKYYNTLTEAISALQDDGTVTLLQDITDTNVGTPMNTADTIRVPDGEYIIITGNGKSITLTPQRADGRAQVFSIPEDSSLILYNVNLTINGLTAAGANGYGDAFDVWGTLYIDNCQAAIQGVTSAFTMQGGHDAEVNITDSTVKATDIRGNFSNGGTWYIESSTVNIDGCENNALSVNKLQVTASDVTINDVGYRGIIITDTETTKGKLSISQGSTVTLKDCCNTTDDNVASIYADGVAVKMDRDDTNSVDFYVDETSTLNAGTARISLSTHSGSSAQIFGQVIGTIVRAPYNDTIVAITGGTGYLTLKAALEAAAQDKFPVYLAADATLSTTISEDVTLVVPNGKVLTVDDLTTVAGSEGAIQVYAGGVLNVDGQNMIGSDSANICLTGGSVTLSKTGSTPGTDLALKLDFTGATAEIPDGNRWTTTKNVEFGGDTYQVPMKVTFDADTVLTVTSTGDNGENDGFRVTNGSTLTNEGKIQVKGIMAISSAGSVTGGGTIEVASGGLLAVRTDNSVTGALANDVTNQGTLVWDGADATGLTGTVTLASGGKVYSQCDLSDKLTGDKRALSDKQYKGVDYTYAWEYYVASSTGGGGGGGVTTYAISLPTDVANGTVTVSPKTASKGTTVTITVTPDEGYELDKLTVTDASGSAVALTKKSDTQYTFSMPGSKVTVAVSFQEIVEAPANPFTDVEEGSFYYDAVLWAVDSGVTNGTSATTFSPDAILTRAEMVTFLWRAHGSPEVTGANPFTDVEEDSFYYDAVLWAVANGITNGTTATTFSPEDPVTRAQAVTFQWRAAGSSAVSGGTFADVPADSWFTGAVTWAVEGGITVGTGGNFFSPEAPVSRAQAVTFLYRELA